MRPEGSRHLVQRPSCPVGADAQTCGDGGACEWLSPGCAEGMGAPNFPGELAGCYPIERCVEGGCAEGEVCAEFVYDPCAGQFCDACGATGLFCVDEEFVDDGGDPVCEGCDGRRGITTGELEFIQVEGGCYALRNADGETFELIGPAAEELLNRDNVGRQFAISYRSCEGMGSICQVGQIVCLESFELVPGGGGDDCPGVAGGACDAGEKCCPLRNGGMCVDDEAPCPVG